MLQGVSVFGPSEPQALGVAAPGRSLGRAAGTAELGPALFLLAGVGGSSQHLVSSRTVSPSPPHTLAHVLAHALAHVLLDACAPLGVLSGKKFRSRQCQALARSARLAQGLLGPRWVAEAAEYREGSAAWGRCGDPRAGFLKVPLKDFSCSEVLGELGVRLEARWTAVLARSSPQEDPWERLTQWPRAPHPPALFPIPRHLSSWRLG